jgi:DNA-binding response OmpR family regulator
MIATASLPLLKNARFIPSPSVNPRQRILVADDDELIRQLNTEVLTYSGYLVDAAKNGAVAWEAIQANTYDLLITDQSMPEVTGVGLLKRLHAARLALPVIMATATYPQDEMAEHPWLQIEASLLKPYTFEELLTTVKNVLHAFNGHHLEFTPPPNWLRQTLPESAGILKPIRKVGLHPMAGL